MIAALRAYQPSWWRICMQLLQNLPELLHHLQGTTGLMCHFQQMQQHTSTSCLFRNLRLVALAVHSCKGPERRI